MPKDMREKNVQVERRSFIASLAALAAVRAVGGGDTVYSKARSELNAMVDGGFCDCAVAGGASGPCVAAASVGSEVSERSLFEVASVSKVFTAAVCARLYAAGDVDIDEPVHGRATLRDLATHTSGYTDGWMARAGVYGNVWPFKTDADYERAAKAAAPTYEKGSKAVYSCTNMILAGFALERKLGMDLDAAAKKYVFGPLGMNSSTWRNVPSTNRLLVRIYTKGPRPLGTKGDENARNFSRPLGNAGVFTSLGDLRLFMRDLLERRAFEKNYYDLLFKCHYDGVKTRRSFGWNMSPGSVPPGWSRGTICHSGYTGQYLAIDPEQGRAACVLTNLKSADGAMRAKSFELRRKIAALLG